MKMKAAVLTSPGGSEKLQVARVDVPWPASPSHVLVRLEAAAHEKLETGKAMGKILLTIRP